MLLLVHVGLYAVSLHYCQDSLLIPIKLAVHQDIAFSRAAPKPVVWYLVPSQGVHPSQVQNFTFVPVELSQVPLAHLHSSEMQVLPPSTWTVLFRLFCHPQSMLVKHALSVYWLMDESFLCLATEFLPPFTVCKSFHWSGPVWQAAEHHTAIQSPLTSSGMGERIKEKKKVQQLVSKYSLIGQKREG